MPTIIALDVSLSMLRPVTLTNTSEECILKHLAVKTIHKFLDLMSVYCRLEFTSLLVYSYLWEQLVAFTRDFEKIRNALTDPVIYNKTCFATVLSGVETLITSEWGMLTPSQVIFVTDGLVDSEILDQCTDLPFSFPCKIHVICLGDPTDKDVINGQRLYEQVIKQNNQGGEVFVCEGSLSTKSIEEQLSRLVHTYMRPYTGLLKCGNLKCNIQVYPPPAPHKNENCEDGESQTISNILTICGFMDITDVSSPAILSRHVVLPITPKLKHDDNTELESDPTIAGPEEGKTPAFTVLLHGSLKVANMVALTKVADDWFGMLFSLADTKKKANLMLALLEPGPTPVSWLGNLNNLTVVSEEEEETVVQFPVKPVDKRSYAQSCIVWINAQGLQGDLQKVIRHARKLPEKQQQFYKEVNRIRKAALSLGFLELLDAVAAMLDRECTVLPGSTHPDAAIQLTHCATVLRSQDFRNDPNYIIPPRVTNFTDGSS